MSSRDRRNSPPSPPTTPEHELLTSSLSRRRFLAGAGVAAAAAALPVSFLSNLGKARAAVLPAVVVEQALSGLVAFVVPGSDGYSQQQGLTHPTPGGVEANAVLPLTYGLNGAGLAPPPFDTLSELAAGVLEQVTGFVNPAPQGPYLSAFANLSFAEKGAVFSIMESGAAGPAVPALASSLLLYAALMSYSEAGVLNPMTGTLVAPPVGWAICDYQGISDGRVDYQGYYRERRSVGEK
jgi:TAT (twin-arginine translocation) pathway signal sequence